MKILPSDRDDKEVVLEHKGRTLLWNIARYRKGGQGTASCPPIVNMFQQINAFWETVEPARQDTMFEIMTKIHSLIQDEVRHRQEQQYHLARQIKLLYAEMPISIVEHWTERYGNIKIPPIVKDRFDNHAEWGSLGKDAYYSITYLRDDYMRLAALAIALRPMTLIWGDYFNSIGSDSDDINADTEALSMLDLTEIAECPAMERLRKYVSAANINKSSRASITIGTFSMDDLYEWLVACIVVRRLTILEVTSKDGSNNLIGMLHMYIGHRVGALEKRNSNIGRVRDKKDRSSSDDEDGNKSLIDLYKIRQDISDADVVRSDVYLSDAKRVASHIEPDLPEDLLKTCLEASDNFDPAKATIFQQTIMAWVASKAISPLSIDHESMATERRFAAVTQAILWHWGLKTIAPFVTAHAKVDSDGAPIGGRSNSGQIPRLHLERFIEIAPYYRAIKDDHLTHDAQTGSGEARKLNPITIAITTLSAAWCRSDWRLNSPEFMLIDGSRDATAPLRPKEELGLLVLKLNEEG